MKIDFDYLSKIRNAFTLKTVRKSSNILEGDFRSVYRGRSMEFDELADYHEGDDVHDIDWNASSRTGQVLVRKYVAERKHFILFVTDSGIKMTGHTSAGEEKTEIACMTMGIAAYLVDRLGADYSLLTATKDSYTQELFRAGMPHLEKLLHICRSHIQEETAADVSELLDFATENIRKRMIVFLITDMQGLMQMDERLIQRVTGKNDLLVANIDDAYLTDDRAYDIRSMRYADSFLPQSRKLRKLEHRQRKDVLDRAGALFRKYRVGFVTLKKEAEIADKVIALFRQGSGTYRE